MAMLQKECKVLDSEMCLVLRTNEEVSNDDTKLGYGLNVPMIY